MKPLSHVRPSVTPWTAAYQAPPSMGFSRQEYWNGVPLPSPKYRYMITIFKEIVYFLDYLFINYPYFWVLKKFILEAIILIQFDWINVFASKEKKKSMPIYTLTALLGKMVQLWSQTALLNGTLGISDHSREFGMYWVVKEMSTTAACPYC